MKLNHGLHLAYCTNIHRGEDWTQTFASLNQYTLAVRQRVCPDEPYAIGLRLSNRAAQELSEPTRLNEFQHWLDTHQCYVFTINGFPFGQFHGTRVKEQVYLPDWTSPARLSYTNLLFDLLAKLVPAGIKGTVSTVPCGFKEFVRTDEQVKMICRHLGLCLEHIARVSESSSRSLQLGLEPEPLCFLETTEDVIRFFEKLREINPNERLLDQHLGLNYDTCHLAVEYERPEQALRTLQKHGIQINKFHLSSALKLRPTPEALRTLSGFADDIYLHQVIVRRPDGTRTAYRDLKEALTSETRLEKPVADNGSASASENEWRIHFHVPLHSPPTPLFDNTADHLLGVLDQLQVNPGLCQHLEMETYTWEVLPAELKDRDVVSQLVAEYQWTLARLAERQLFGTTKC